MNLVERKQRQARQRIVEVAEELFVTSGFDNVSVSEIAERAEVGRTTFFRHFGDKQEVLFSKYEDQLAVIAAARDVVDSAPARNAYEAIEQIRPIVLEILTLVTADPVSYARHFRIIEQSQDLQGREAAKLQQLGDGLSQLLIYRGTDRPTAVFAAQVALACCHIAKALGNNPHTLLSDTQDAFVRVLALGSEPRARRPKRSTTNTPTHG